MIPDSLRPFIARIAGIIVASLAVWLAAHFNIVLSENDKAKLTEGMVILTITVWGLIYAVTHRLTSKKSNPADAATTKLAHKGKVSEHQ